MALLVLLNGPPASGKSTIARRFVDARPLALSLDIDVVRGMLGAWLDEPTAAGNRARALALAMAETHLTAGHDVIVPQFLGRPAFVDQLSAVAERTDATFIEAALWLDRRSAIDAFSVRRASPGGQIHDDATALVDRSEQADPVGRMYDAFVDVIDGRPATRRVEATRGDVDGTYRRFAAALDIDA